MVAADFAEGEGAGFVAAAWGAWWHGWMAGWGGGFDADGGEDVVLGGCGGGGLWNCSAWRGEERSWFLCLSASVSMPLFASLRFSLPFVRLFKACDTDGS